MKFEDYLGKIRSLYFYDEGIPGNPIARCLVECAEECAEYALAIMTDEPQATIIDELGDVVYFAVIINFFLGAYGERYQGFPLSTTTTYLNTRVTTQREAEIEFVKASMFYAKTRKHWERDNGMVKLKAKQKQQLAGLTFQLIRLAESEAKRHGLLLPHIFERNIEKLYGRRQKDGKQITAKDRGATDVVV